MAITKKNITSLLNLRIDVNFRKHVDKLEQAERTMKLEETQNQKHAVILDFEFLLVSLLFLFILIFRVLSILKTDDFHEDELYIEPMLWSDSGISLPNINYFSVAQLNSLNRRFYMDPTVRKKYAVTIRNDLQKGYVITVK